MPRIDPFAPVTKTKPAREIAYDFVLDRLAPLAPSTRPMFGSHGVYLEERVICILRKKGDGDDGVWVCFEPELEAEVLALLPTLKRIDRLGNVRNWRKLAANSSSFEDDVLKVCALLLAGDTRIGKLPDRLKAKRKALSKPKATKPDASRSRASADKPSQRAEPAKRTKAKQTKAAPSRAKPAKAAPSRAAKRASSTPKKRALA